MFTVHRKENSSSVLKTPEESDHTGPTLIAAVMAAARASKYGKTLGFDEIRDIANDLEVQGTTNFYWATYTWEGPKVLTLNEALTAVANASIGDYPTAIIPIVRADADPTMDMTVFGYTIDTNDRHDGIQTDEVTWSYDDGIDRGPETEITRLFDAAETWDSARHVSYNLPEAVEQLRAGKPVWIGYAVVNDSAAVFDEDNQCYRDANGELTDEVAGWCALAYWDDKD